MELHRLKTMNPEYDSKLFNQLYKDTELLRKSLANQIDCRRYGVTRDIILSWFDDKFIFVFNKHCIDKDPEVLKGFIINSLQLFKNRILRKAYSREADLHTSTFELDGESELINIIPIENEMYCEDLFLQLALSFMKEKLSDDAYFLFNLELNPPPYIINKISNAQAKVPSRVFAEYMDLGINNKAIKYINQLRKEIRICTTMAKEHFGTLAIAN